MEQLKSISLKIDETIDSFLNFTFRLLLTFWILLSKPHKPQIVLNHLSDSPPIYVRPLTFLSIGAFFFTILMSVYPKGLFGMIDLIWFADDFKGEIRTNWKQALSITNLFVMGMPAIITITGISTLSSRLLFKDSRIQTLWFRANCYIFGFQMLIMFLCLSLDSVMYGILKFIPFFDLENYSANESEATILAGIFISCILIGLLWPYIFLSACLIKLRLFVSFQNQFLLVVFVFAYGLGLQYIYSASASVFPDLEKHYLEETKVEEVVPSADLSYLNISVNENTEEERIFITIDGLIHNPFNEDLFIDFKDSDIEVFVGSNSETQSETWFGDFESIRVADEKIFRGALIITPKSIKQVNLTLSFSLSKVKAAKCYLIKQNLRARETDSDLYSIFLSINGGNLPDRLDFESVESLDDDVFYAGYLEECKTISKGVVDSD